MARGAGRTARGRSAIHCGLLDGERARLVLLSLRFAHNLTVRQIALRRGIDPKVLYRRFDRMLRQVRASIAAQSQNS